VGGKKGEKKAGKELKKTKAMRERRGKKRQFTEEKGDRAVITNRESANTDT